jgi:hypothetical protein
MYRLENLCKRYSEKKGLGNAGATNESFKTDV